MKTFMTIVMVCGTCCAMAQEWGHELGLNYTYINPVGPMERNISRGHGGALTFDIIMPEKPFSFGIEVGIAEYGRDKSTQEYTFGDGTTADMDVVVANNVYTIMPTARWYLSKSSSFRPYIGARAGYTWYKTSLNIYDPNDTDQCEPVDRDILYRDGAWVGSLGAGAKLDLSMLIGGLDKDRFDFEASFFMTQGGLVKYMNTDAPAGAGHGDHDSDHVMAEFINTDTKIVHKHHVGTLYQSRVQMNEFRAGFVYKLD